MTQKQWKMISTIISIIIVVVFVSLQGFWRAKATINQILILHRKRLRARLIHLLQEPILITLRA